MGCGNRMRGFALYAALGGAAWAQSALPPTNPTSLPPSSPTPPTSVPMHQAQVSYQMGQLTVLAENSSLNQILREVARQTGMKIIGSIADQQVYGTYGPAAPAKVLGQLLEGTGVNMILRENAARDPVELVLMPTQGMPTFSSQPVYSPLPYVSQPPQSLSPPQYPVPTQVNGGQAGTMQPPPPVAQTDTTSAPDPQPQPASDVPQSSNGVRTPQQIFEELQRMERQKAQQSAPAQ